MITKKRIGDILVDSGFVTEQELQKALEVQKGSDKRLGQVLKELGLTTEQDLREALEYQLGIPQVDLKKFIIDPDVINMISKSLAERHLAIPINKKKNTLTVAMSDPLDVLAIDDIRIKTGYEVDPVIASESQIKNAIDQYFGDEDIVNEIEDEMDANLQSEDITNLGEVNNVQDMVDEAPVVRLANSIINKAIKERASDIHIEPQAEGVRVRFRIDGILYDEMKVSKYIHPALVSRIKIMADLDIAERRIPQDGRVRMVIKDREVDLRVSTLPTVKGEKVVIRILDKNNLMLDLDSLGFLSGQKKIFKKMINQPHGMLLITGPTGSGKTTTLYSALSTLDIKQKNIITIEDPVEYRLDGINQVQVNPKAGLNFANGLRSILRQDPDIVMIGEIRDSETARIAIQAALTGHLVLSTLHTNTAAGALSRLVNMDIEPFLIASAVMGVVGQRLVRTICEECKEKITEKSTLDNLKSYLNSKKQDSDIYQGVGCDFCGRTGYRGRTATHEILDVNKDIKELIIEKASAAKIEEEAKQSGMLTLEDSALFKVNQGLTTLEEAMRVTKVARD